MSLYHIISAVTRPKIPWNSIRKIKNSNIVAFLLSFVWVLQFRSCIHSFGIHHENCFFSITQSKNGITDPITREKSKGRMWDAAIVFMLSRYFEKDGTISDKFSCNNFWFWFWFILHTYLFRKLTQPFSIPYINWESFKKL